MQIKQFITIITITATTGTTPTAATTAATVLQLLQVLLRLPEHSHYSTNSGGWWPGTFWAVLHQYSAIG